MCHGLTSCMGFCRRCCSSRCLPIARLAKVRKSLSEAPKCCHSSHAALGLQIGERHHRDRQCSHRRQTVDNRSPQQQQKFRPFCPRNGQHDWRGQNPDLCLTTEVQTTLVLQSISHIASEFRTWVLTDQLVTFWTKPVWGLRNADFGMRNGWGVVIRQAPTQSTPPRHSRPLRHSRTCGNLERSLTTRAKLAVAPTQHSNCRTRLYCVPSMDRFRLI